MPVVQHVEEETERIVSWEKIGCNNVDVTKSYCRKRCITRDPNNSSRKFVLMCFSIVTSWKIRPHGKLSLFYTYMAAFLQTKTSHIPL